MFYNIKYNIAINVKIAMGYVVSYTNHIYPWYLRSFSQQAGRSQLVNLLDSFAYSFYQHTACRKIFHTIRRAVVIINRLYVCVPIFQLDNGSPDLVKNSPNPII